MPVPRAHDRRVPDARGTRGRGEDARRAAGSSRRSGPRGERAPRPRAGGHPGRRSGSARSCSTRSTASSSPRTEMLLFAASRAQLVAEVIRPALAAGYTRRLRPVRRRVPGVSGHRARPWDRGGPRRERGRDGRVAARPDAAARHRSGGGPAAGACGRPPAPAGSDAWDGGDRLERETVAFHERVREGFLSLAGNDPRRIRVVDARGSVDDVHQAIWHLVDGFLRSAQRPEGRDRRP